MSASGRGDIRKGQRFAFGANWATFLSVLNDARIVDAQEYRRRLLDVRDCKRLCRDYEGR